MKSLNLKNIASLIKYLTLREISTRYKQSFLGFFWVILNPFFQMLIISFVFSQVMRTQNIKVAYPVFLYAGLLPWIFFVNSLSSSMNVFINDSALIKKIYFPREVLVLSTLLAKTFDFFISSIIFLILMAYFKIPFTFYMLFFFVIFFIQFLFTFSLSLFLSWTNLFYRDVQYLFNLIISLWFYLTPIIYSVEFLPKKYQFIFKFNPMAVFINAYRQVLLGGKFPNFFSLTIGIITSLILFFFSYKLFKKIEKNLADIV